MPEYYGYKVAEQPNFGKSIANVAELFVAAEEKRAAKREGEQKSLDASRKKINEIEQNSNKSQSELVGSGANKTRNYILELERMRKSGQITGAEFNRRMTNVNDSWDNYAFVTKNMNERLAENLARAQSGEASSNELFLAKIQSELMNTKNKDIMVGEDGNMYMVDKNDPSKPISLRSGGNIDNIVDNKIDVPTLVQDAVSKFGDFSQESGSTTESGARLQKELYDATKYDIIHSIVDKDNPRGVVSILMDNAGSDYDQYYNNEQKTQLLNDAVKREETLKGPMNAEQKAKFISDYEKNNMIEYVADDNGSYQPVITDKMVKDAENYVDRTIEMQVGRTKTEDEDRVSRGGGPAGPKNSKVTELEQQQLAAVRDGWNLKGNDGKDSADALRKASNDQYYFEWTDGGLNVYSQNPNPSMKEYNAQMAKYNKASEKEKDQGTVKKPTMPEKPKPLKTVSSVEGLYPYFFGNSGEAKWLTELERQRAGGGTPKKSTTNTTSQKKFN